MREMAPVGEMAPGCAKKYKKEILKNPFAPGAISRMITVLSNGVVPVHYIGPYGVSSLSSSGNVGRGTAGITEVAKRATWVL